MGWIETIIPYTIVKGFNNLHIFGSENLQKSWQRFKYYLWLQVQTLYQQTQTQLNKPNNCKASLALKSALEVAGTGNALTLALICHGTSTWAILGQSSHPLPLAPMSHHRTIL